MRLTDRPGDAEDLVAQTLLHAAAGWEAFDGRHPVAWLIRIMNNAYLRRREVESRAPTVPLDESCEIRSDANPYRHVESRMTLEQVLEAMNRLTPEHRMAITLCDIEELPYHEVSEALGIPRGTLCSRLFRARRALQTYCAEVGVEVE